MAALRPGDVLVRVRASGLCHTDLEVIQGSLAYPLPIVLGHEGAGIVEAVGSDVRLGQAGRSRDLLVEPELRPLLLLRPRPADPLRALHAASAAGPSARRRFAAQRRRAQAASLLRRVLACGVLRRSRVRRDRRAEGDPVRPRLPDRLRRDDRRRRRRPRGAHRRRQLGGGDRLRRGRPECRAGGDAAARRHHHRAGPRSGAAGDGDSFSAQRIRSMPAATTLSGRSRR